MATRTCPNQWEKIPPEKVQKVGSEFEYLFFILMEKEQKNPKWMQCIEPNPSRGKSRWCIEINIVSSYPFQGWNRKAGSQRRVGRTLVENFFFFYRIKKKDSHPNFFFFFFNIYIFDCWMGRWTKEMSHISFAPACGGATKGSKWDLRLETARHKNKCKWELRYGIENIYFFLFFFFFFFFF